MRQLLIVSSRVKHFTAIQSSVHPTVLLLHYRYETCTGQSLLDDVKRLLQGGKIDCVGFVLHGTLTSINICGKEDITLTKDNLVSSDRVRHFLISLADTCLSRNAFSRVVWFTTSLGQAADGAVFAKHLQSLLQVPVDLCRDFSGPEVANSSDQQPADGAAAAASDDNQLPVVPQQSAKPCCVGELFFRPDKLKSLNSSFQQSLAGFEKIRIVGKGAYGTAVLYRKRDDDSLVILKEINLHDLNFAERQMALNEVNVLSLLNHPHIISYYDSFEEEGSMLIEMEYADGGTLSDYLRKVKDPLEERRIVEMFQQIVAAIAYVHERNILHRDIKTANIFLSRDGTLKIGDFGISKMLSTAHPGTNTVLGTPYYISPEMCEGKIYDAKSDIWALGCILYEMACLQRTFDGTNLPALVNKIIKGQFAPIKGNYSEPFKQLVFDLLQQDPEKRPSAKVIAEERLPVLLSHLKDSASSKQVSGSGENNASSLANNAMTGTSGGQLTGTKSSSANSKRIRSVLYYLDLTTFGLFPVYLPPKTRIKEVAVGANHVVVLTADMLVFAWGEGTKGQLGHGDFETRYQPAMVESLKDKAVAHVCCGTNFTVFGSLNGIVMTCGDGSKGCLGHGDWNNLSKPRLIEALLSVDATSVSCGPEHVVAIGTGGVAYAWGQGANGRLGYGSEENFCSPQLISFSSGFSVKGVRCGSNASMFFTDSGVVLASGSNEYNKLGLNNRQGFLMAMKNIFTKTEVDGALTPTIVKSLSQYRVVDAALGPFHTILLSDTGQVITVGRNSLGQLGLGNRRVQRRPTAVSKLKAPVNFIASSTTFSVAGSKLSNAVYFWGARRHPVADGCSRRRHNHRSRVRSGSLQRRASSNASTRSGESFSDDDSLDSVLCSSSDIDDDVDSLRAMSIAGSRERLGEPGSAGSDHRRQSSSDRQAQSQSNSLQNSSSKVTTGGPSVIGAQRSLSVEGLSVNTNSNSGGDGGANNNNNPSPVAPMSASEVNARLTQQQQLQHLQNRQRLPSFGSPGLPIGSAGSGSGDIDEELQILLTPTHILRLQSTGSDEKREIVEISGLHCHGSNLFVHVETTAPPPRRSQAPKPTKEAFKSPKDAPHPLYEGNSNGGGSNSVPGSAESGSMAMRKQLSATSELKDVPEWLRKEFDEAETGTRLVTASQQSSLVSSQTGGGEMTTETMTSNNGSESNHQQGARAMSMGSSLGSHSGLGASRIALTSVVTTDDEDMSSVAVADDELEDDGGSVALTTTDADDEPAVAIKINPQLTRSYHQRASTNLGLTSGQKMTKLPSRSSVSQQSRTYGGSHHRHSRAGAGGIPPAGPSAANLTSGATERAPRRGHHHKSLSIGGGLNSTNTNLATSPTQHQGKYPASSTSTSASSQRPPLSGKAVRSPAGVVPSQRTHRIPSDLSGHATTDGGIDSSPTSGSNVTSATTRVETLVLELEERHRAEREQIRREAEETARERERLLQDEIEKLRTQLALQQVLSSSGSSSLPVTHQTQERIISPTSSVGTGDGTIVSSNRPPSGNSTTNQSKGGAGSESLSQSGKLEKPASRVCLIS